MKKSRVGRIHYHISHAGVFTDRENRLPGLSTIVRFVESPITARSPQRTLSCDINYFAVAWVDHNASDMFRLFQSQILPTLAAIVGAVDSVSVSHAALAIALTRAHPYYRGIVGIKHHPADRVGALAVEDRRPRRAVVNRFPHTARSHTDVVLCVVLGIHRERNHASGGYGRANQTKL